MSVEEVLALPSIDSQWHLAGSWLKYVPDEFVEDIRVHGLKHPIHVTTIEKLTQSYSCNPPPAGIAPTDLGLGNGHHRLAVAVRLGWLWVETTDLKEESG